MRSSFVPSRTMRIVNCELRTANWKAANGNWQLASGDWKPLAKFCKQSRANVTKMPRWCAMLFGQVADWATTNGHNQRQRRRHKACLALFTHSSWLIAVCVWVCLCVLVCSALHITLFSLARAYGKGRATTMHREPQYDIVSVWAVGGGACSHSNASSANCCELCVQIGCQLMQCWQLCQHQLQLQQLFF